MASESGLNNWVSPSESWPGADEAPLYLKTSELKTQVICSTFSYTQHVIFRQGLEISIQKGYKSVDILIISPFKFLNVAWHMSPISGLRFYFSSLQVILHGFHVHSSGIVAPSSELFLFHYKWSVYIWGILLI